MEKDYATQKRKFEESYLKQHQDRNACWQASEASYRNRYEQSWEIKEETIKDIIKQNYPGLL